MQGTKTWLIIQLNLRILEELELGPSVWLEPKSWAPFHRDNTVTMILKMMMQLRLLSPLRLFSKVLTPTTKVSTSTANTIRWSWIQSPTTFPSSSTLILHRRLFLKKPILLLFKTILRVVPLTKPHKTTKSKSYNESLL